MYKICNLCREKHNNEIKVQIPTTEQQKHIAITGPVNKKRKPALSDDDESDSEEIVIIGGRCGFFF